MRVDKYPLITANQLDAHIKRQTSSADLMARAYMGHGYKWVTDERKDDRLRDKKCKTCFYLRGPNQLGQASLTESLCEVCGKDFWNGSTNVLRNCGEHDGLCRRCTGEID